MITTRLTGGLGNQMFQYALGRRLALDRGVGLALDLGWFGNEQGGDTRRSYALDGFALDADRALVKGRSTLREPANRRQLAQRLARERLDPRSRILRQRGTGFDAAVLDAPDGTHLVGFWQSERYFDGQAAAIRADFVPTVTASAEARSLHERVSTDASVSLHVRRGDYVSNADANRYHGTLDPEHYRRAVEMVAERTSVDLELFIFSDDVAWCAEHLALAHATTFVELPDTSPIIDLALMAACRHHVIANSSFSWWGAWLDPRPDHVVVAPRAWAQNPGADFSTIYCPGWLRL
jgi:hypothetical protein